MVSGSKKAVVIVLWPKIPYDNFLTVLEIQHVHHTVCLLLRPRFTDQPIKMRQRDMVLKHKTAYLKLLSLPLLLLPLFFSMHKTSNCQSVIHHAFCLPLAHADEVLFFYSNVHRSVRLNRCPHLTVYMHVVPKFIRSMSHSVTCNDLIGLLKSCSVEGFNIKSAY